jgi:creatinine amidohydrolase
VDGHAGERESSMILAIRPELVKGESMPSDGEGMPLDRLKPLRDLGTDMGIWWYADYPTHYCGDGRSATAQKGEVWFADRSRALAKVVRAIKDDKETKRLQDEFFGKIDKH